LGDLGDLATPLAVYADCSCVLLLEMNGPDDYELPEPIVGRLERGVRRALATRQVRPTSIAMGTVTLVHVDEELAKERSATASPAEAVLTMLAAIMHKPYCYLIIIKYVMLWTYVIATVCEQIMATTS